MTVPDVVDVLLHQHDQMRQLCAQVQLAHGPEKRRLFVALDQLVNRHEIGDHVVVHPAVRNSGASGDRIGVACMAEEGSIQRALAGLHVLGVEHATFDIQFATVHQDIRDHAAHEERDEFPLLYRYVSAQRRHMMAGELHDVQVMSGS